MDMRSILKGALIKELKLEDLSAEDIEDDAPLFGEGLGLDSLDTMELVVLLERDFGVHMEDIEEARKAFTSINALAEYIEAHGH
jgi:acyl carrier protein